jgi:hypothetical protein
MIWVSREVATLPALNISTFLRLGVGEHLERLDSVDLPDDGKETLHLGDPTKETEMWYLLGADEFPLDSGIQLGIDRLEIAGKKCFIELLRYCAVWFILCHITPFLSGRHSDSGEDFNKEFGIEVGDNLDDPLLPHHHREAIDLIVAPPGPRYP